MRRMEVKVEQRPRDGEEQMPARLAGDHLCSSAELKRSQLLHFSPVPD